MYKSFYKLKENPFSLTPDPQFLYLSSIHKRAIAYLQYALQENKGFSVITGEIGAGKTTVIKAILTQFREQAKIAHITNPSPNPHQLLRMIAEEYEIRQSQDSGFSQSSPPDDLVNSSSADLGNLLTADSVNSPMADLVNSSSADLGNLLTADSVNSPMADLGNLSSADLADLDLANSVKVIHSYLLHQYADGFKVVLIIDEAQRLSCQSMEEIRLLSNLETEKDKLIHIILSGQPELRNLLASPQLKQLKQRISLWFHILPLSFKETTEYIQHRMSRAGCPSDPFTRQAVKCIYRASGGIPRVINIACDAALLAGYGEQKHKIKACLVEKALDELNLNPEKKDDSKDNSKNNSEDNSKDNNKDNNNKSTILNRWKLHTGSKAVAPGPQLPQLPEHEELELLSQAVDSLYQKYRQRGEESEETLKQSCFPDDLSSLQDRKFENAIILSQIIALSQAIDALSKRIGGN
jgi:type II secretory pathway predicted ATPase ExeA